MELWFTRVVVVVHPRAYIRRFRGVRALADQHPFVHVSEHICKFLCIRVCQNVVDVGCIAQLVVFVVFSSQLHNSLPNRNDRSSWLWFGIIYRESRNSDWKPGNLSQNQVNVNRATFPNQESNQSQIKIVLLFTILICDFKSRLLSTWHQIWQQAVHLWFSLWCVALLCNNVIWLNEWLSTAKRTLINGKTIKSKSTECFVSKLYNCKIRDPSEIHTTLNPFYS